MKGSTIPHFTILVAGLVLLTLLPGCETQVDASLETELSLQARNALEVLPAHAQAVSMMNFQELKRNPNLARLQHEAPSGEFLRGENAARLHDFLDATGFDPEKDLNEIYVAAGGTGEESAASMVAYANFDRERLLQYIEDNLGDTFETSDHRGITVFRSVDARHPLSFSIVNENMIVASSRDEEVFDMIARLSGEGSAIKDNREIMQLIGQTGGNAWFVIHDLPARASSGEKSLEIEQLGRAVKDFAVSVVAESDKVEGVSYLIPVEGISSKDLADLTRGAIAALKAAKSEEKSENGKFLDQIRVREAGDRVQVTFEVENSDFPTWD